MSIEMSDLSDRHKEDSNMPSGIVKSKVSNAELLDSIRNLHTSVGEVKRDVGDLKCAVGDLRNNVKDLDVCIRGDGQEKKGLVGRIDKLDWTTTLMIRIIAPIGSFMVVAEIILWFEHHGLTGLFFIK
jgi:hypothetical protein